ncbi:uncharacterized protein PHALS_03751 [Plasmopara halstedii]|uniref:Uncharacterized protein n=1 Tax=Plasmopara halstedii TaxID=4781 RepID=A0A0P1B1A1_PLAHL|nr:uncharacterized protein PHALS_03751 [Plasmopara halstedii]CEG47096.1 hypothetical protein PHALS_03751 [Plasmopara halstedii]|eukprot:XP_024583465.1 hypothetical protein PHALS_03751 [Plasmopara halstedii]
MQSPVATSKRQNSDIQSQTSVSWLYLKMRIVGTLERSVAESNQLVRISRKKAQKKDRRQLHQAGGHVHRREIVLLSCARVLNDILKLPTLLIHCSQLDLAIAVHLLWKKTGEFVAFRLFFFNNLGTVRLQYTGNETRCGDSTRTIGSLYSCDRDKRFYLEHVLRVTFKACMTIAAYQMLFERVLRLTGEKKAFMAATYLFLRWKMASLDIAN